MASSNDQTIYTVLTCVNEYLNKERVLVRHILDIQTYSCEIHVRLNKFVYERKYYFIQSGTQLLWSHNLQTHVDLDVLTSHLCILIGKLLNIVSYIVKVLRHLLEDVEFKLDFCNLDTVVCNMIAYIKDDFMFSLDDIERTYPLTSEITLRHADTDHKCIIICDVLFKIMEFFMEIDNMYSPDIDAISPYDIGTCSPFIGSKAS